MTPKPYISFSQMALFEMKPKDYADRYIYGKEQYVNKNMEYGTALADAMEHGDASGDPLMDLVITKIPRFALRDKAFEAELKDGKEVIRLLAKPDTCKRDYSAFKEYKTSTRKWTQRMADESGQITFYATAIWLKTDKIPHDIELVDIVVEYDENGRLRPTGQVLTFKTQRSMVDIIKMTSRIKKAWAGIKQLCEEELL